MLGEDEATSALVSRDAREDRPAGVCAVYCRKHRQARLRSRPPTGQAPLWPTGRWDGSPPRMVRVCDRHPATHTWRLMPLIRPPASPNPATANTMCRRARVRKRVELHGPPASGSTVTSVSVRKSRSEAFSTSEHAAAVARRGRASASLRSGGARSRSDALLAVSMFDWSCSDWGIDSAHEAIIALKASLLLGPHLVTALGPVHVVPQAGGPAAMISTRASIPCDGRARAGACATHCGRGGRAAWRRAWARAWRAGDPARLCVAGAGSESVAETSTLQPRTQLTLGVSAPRASTPAGRGKLMCRTGATFSGGGHRPGPGSLSRRV